MRIVGQGVSATPKHPAQLNGMVLPSTGVTCGGLCLRKEKNARWRVPAHSGGVFAFFDEVEKRKHPTPKGSVREPGSLTHPMVTPIEMVLPQILNPKPGLLSAVLLSTPAPYLLPKERVLPVVGLAEFCCV